MCAGNEGSHSQVATTLDLEERCRRDFQVNAKCRSEGSTYMGESMATKQVELCIHVNTYRASTLSMALSLLVHWNPDSHIIKFVITLAVAAISHQSIKSGVEQQRLGLE